MNNHLILMHFTRFIMCNRLCFHFFVKIYIYLAYKEAIVKFKRIKDLREDNDKLQKDIANLLGIPQQYYSEYENGKRTIPIQHLITLANYYNISIDYIVGLSDLKKKKTS